jgi:hypothetical protein
MRLAKDQGENVKVTIQPYPYVKGIKGVNKSFIVYDTTSEEVLAYLTKALESTFDDEDDDDGEE